jgi:hypothetical protein
LSKLKSAAQQNGEELGAMLTGRLDEVRQDISTIGSGQERVQTQLAAKLEESGQQIKAGLSALSAQAATATAEKQATDAQLVAAVAMLRTGIDQQNETLKRAVETLAQQSQTQHQASLDALAAGLADVTKRVGVVQRRVRWFGIFGLLFVARAEAQFGEDGGAAASVTWASIHALGVATSCDLLMRKLGVDSVGSCPPSGPQHGFDLRPRTALVVPMRANRL